MMAVEMAVRNGPLRTILENQAQRRHGTVGRAEGGVSLGVGVEILRPESRLEHFRFGLRFGRNSRQLARIIKLPADSLRRRAWTRTGQAIAIVHSRAAFPG